MGASPRRKFVQQIMATMSCIFAVMSVGNIIGWSSPAVIKFDENSPIVLTTDEIGWVVSLLYIGTFMGPILFAFMTESVGRKWITFTAGSIILLGWVICLLAKKVSHIFVARIIHGVGISFTLCIVPLYVGEIVEDNIRGGVTAAIMMFTALGNLYTYVIGPHVSFQILNLVSLLFPLLTLLSFFKMPESPYFLIMNGRLEEAEKNLMRLRGETERREVQQELDKIIDFVEDGFSKEPIGRKLRLFFQFKHYFGAFAMVATLTFAQQFSGNLAFKSYFEIIFNVLDSPIDPSDAVIIAECIAVVSASLSAYFIDKIGRRPMYMVSALGCFLGTTLIGSYDILSDHEIISKSYSWIAMIGIYGHQVFFYFGLGCIPSVVTSELFPAHLKTWTTALYVMLSAAFGFCVTKLFQIVGDDFGYYYSFWMLSFCLIFPTIYVYIFMIETKQKSFFQIQNDLSKKTGDSIESQRNSINSTVSTLPINTNC